MHLGSAFYTDDEIRSFPFRSIGKNVKIKKNASLYFIENISISDNSRIDDFSVIVASGEHVRIGSHVHIASHCYISGSAGIDIDDFCGLAPSVNIFTSSDDYTGQKMTNPTLPRDLVGGAFGRVVFGRHVIIGSGTVILPSVIIGNGTSVGSQSLVNKSLDEWSIYAGVPAKRIRDRSRNILNLEKEYLSRRGEEE